MSGERARPTEVGDNFFLAGVDDDFGVFCHEYIVTAIRKGKVHLVEKNRWTFDPGGKLKGNVDDCWRRSFELGVSGEFARSPAGAYAKALPELERRAKALAKIIGSIKGQRTRSRTKGRRPPALSDDGKVESFCQHKECPVRDALKARAGTPGASDRTWEDQKP